MTGPARVRPSLSVIMPALNEEDNIAGAVDTVTAVLGETDQPFEILIFNDGSTDRTGAIAEELARRFREVRVIHHPWPKGLGASYREGVELAVNEYVVMIPGDNDVPAASMQAMCERIGSADIVAPYCKNPGVRSQARQRLSSTFTWMVNVMFGLKLRYFNGPCIHRRALALAGLPDTSGFAYMAVLLVRLVSSGYTVTEVGIDLSGRVTGRSKAFGFKNVLSVGQSLLALFFAIRIMGRRWRAPTPVSLQNAAG